MPRKKLSGMAEALGKYHAWFRMNKDRFADQFEDAVWMFFGPRPDLADIEQTEDTHGSFNEWLTYDFPTNGYNETSPAERQSLMAIFLDEQGSCLSAGAKVFADNANESIASFYVIELVEAGKYFDAKDLFFGDEKRVYDMNFSNVLEAGDIVYGRFSEDENGQNIGVGYTALLVAKSVFPKLKKLIDGTYAAVVKSGIKMTMEEFFKWNSYIYYREIIAINNGKSDQRRRKSH